MNRYDPIQTTENVIDWDKDPFIKYQDLFKDTIDWAKDPMSHPANQNKYFYSDGKTYYEQICKMLKLMSAFKESFAYIYENEEELHSAWENFVDNLSASAQYGEEVGVTLTWTEDSVNFDFTIPGGEDGVGIQSIVFNLDYTMTITLTDGTVYNSPSLRGPQGETGATGAQGPQGPQGEGLEILDVYPTLSDLQTAHPTGSAGDAYQVGTSPNFTLYIWSTSQQAWVSAGALTSPDATTTTPLMDGSASVGSENAYARGDHRHPTDTSRASASDLTTVSENLLELTGDVSDMADVLGAVQTEIEDLSDIVQVSQSLIDQEFLYRGTPADHDTIARINSIKGNTISFNQLIENGNFADTSGWNASAGITFTVSNNIATIANSEDANAGLSRNIRALLTNGHKYYIGFDARQGSSTNAFYFYYDATVNTRRAELNTSGSGNFEKLSTIVTVVKTDSPGTNFGNFSFRSRLKDYPLQVKNVMVFDLTLMGIDNLTTTEEVEAYINSHLGNLDYFGFTLGTLIPFNGTGLKTTGKNLTSLDSITTLSGGYINRTNSSLGDVRKGEQYTLSFNNLTTATNNTTVRIYVNGTNVDQTNKSLVANSRNDFTFTASDNGELYLSTQLAFSEQKVFDEIQLELSDTPTTYEAYQSNTLSLPTSTYFPTGMKSIIFSRDGYTYEQSTARPCNYDFYDLLVPTKATNLIDVYTFTGEETWESSGQSYYADVGISSSAKKPSNGQEYATILHDLLETVTANELYYGAKTDGIAMYNNGRIYISSSRYANISSLTGSKLYYVLNTATETSISPELDMTYPVWNGGTEQILPVNDSTPDTAPLLADMTYMSTDEAIQYLYDLLGTIDQGLDTIIETLDTFIGTTYTTLTDMSGYVLYTYTSTDTNQGLTTQQLDYSILNECNYVEIFYTEYLNGNIQKSSGKLPFKMLNSTVGDVAMNTNISQTLIGQTSVRTIGWNSSGSMTISRCQTTYDDNTQEYTDNKMIVRKIVSYNINETTSN